MPPHDMECTLVPDLWFTTCCQMHDLTGNDLGFLFCMLGITILIGTAFVLVLWLGMLVMRPIRRWLYEKGILKYDDK